MLEMDVHTWKQQQQQQFICTVLYKKKLQVELNEYIVTGHPQ